MERESDLDRIRFKSSGYPENGCGKDLIIWVNETYLKPNKNLDFSTELLFMLVASYPPSKRKINGTFYQFFIETTYSAHGHLSPSAKQSSKLMVKMRALK